MSYPYTVTVTIGGTLTFTSSDTDAPDFGLGDGLTVTRSLPQSDFWPLQPDPATAQLSLIVETPEDALEAQVIGATVAIEVSNSSAVPLIESFYGRVADVELSPVMLGPATPGGPKRPAVQIALICADYLADLAELVPGVGFAAGVSTTRVTDVFTAIGRTRAYVPWVPVIIPAPTTATMAARDPSTDSAAVILEEVLGSWAVDPDWAATSIGAPGFGRYRYVVEPHITAGLLDPVSNYFLRPAYERQNRTPGRLGDTGAGYGVIMPPSVPGDDSLSLDACFVNRSVKWTRRKGGAVNTVVVSSATSSYTAQLPGVTVPVTARVDSVPVTGAGDLDRLGELFLPASDVNPWGTDALVWEQWADDPGLRFPGVGGVLAGVVAVGGILDEWTPELGRTWMAGAVGTKEFTLSDGKPRVTFTLRQAVMLSSSGNPSDRARWDDVDPAVTWDDLRAGDTWDDYGLLGR